MILSAKASLMPGSVMSCSLLAVFKSINSASDLAGAAFFSFCVVLGGAAGFAP